MTWTITARESRGYERAVMASEGMLDLMRASHFAFRGVARVVMSGLPVVGAGAGAYWFMREVDGGKEVSATVIAGGDMAAAPAGGLDVQSVYREVKRAHGM